MGKGRFGGEECHGKVRDLMDNYRDLTDDKFDLGYSNQ